MMTEKGLIQPAGLPSKKPLSEPGISAWDPKQTGSYPPRPIDMLMFNTIKYHHLQLIQVEDMTPDVMAHKPQPETDVQPAEGRPVKGLSWVDVQGIPHRIAQPLELFDNPELDLVHPSLDILEVNSIPSSSPQKLQINSPLAFASQTPPTPLSVCCCVMTLLQTPITYVSTLRFGNHQVENVESFCLFFFLVFGLTGEKQIGFQKAHKAGKQLIARSKWYANDGSFTWAPCEVVDYHEESEAYTIKWLSSGKEKNVRR